MTTTRKTLRLGTAVLAALTPALSLQAQRWTSRTGPPPLVEGAVAFDAARGQLVRFGGSPLNYYYVPNNNLFNDGDTWVRGTSGWHDLRPALAPPRLSKHSMTYDAARQRVVLFGGTLPSGANNVATWEFDGTQWLLATPPHSPPAMRFAFMAYDGARSRCVLFDRQGNPNTTRVWEYDGNDWQPVTTVGSPPGDLYGGFAPLPILGVCVLAGWRYNTVPASFETWHYDGIDWTLVPTANTPSHGGALATAANNAVSLFGFDGQSANTFRTWRYDGTDWTQVITAHAPDWFGEGPAAYDPARGVVTMAGLTETWEFDGADWTLAEPWQGVPKRSAAALAHDTRRGRTVMFGGQTDTGTTDEQWEWDGNTWQVVPQTLAPAARYGAFLVYDSRRQRLVLFGGRSATNGPLDDTWELSGGQWQQINPAHRPGGEVQAMAYDPIRGLVVAYEYFSSMIGSRSRTWTYDGVDWTEVPTPVQLQPRYLPAMAFDNARGVLVLFGGSGGMFSDTWEFDGAWQQRNPQVRPPSATGRATFDPVRGRVVLEQGEAPGGTVGGWREYDGQLWTPIANLASPAPHFAYPMVFDAERQRLLRIGQWGDVWELEPEPAARWARLGVGCANGPSLDAAGSSLPNLGGTFTLELSGLPPQPGAAYLAYGFDIANLAGATLPIELGFLGLPGCNLWLAPSRGDVVVHGGAAVQRSLPIPNTPSLAGVHFAAQALVFDAAAPLPIGAVSNAGIATVY